jgi:hypothetical protein
MLKRIALLILAAAFCLGSSACKEETTQAEKQAEKVKQFRAAQKLKAIKAYKDLTTKYPDSEFAPKAREKLQQIAPPAPPKK